MHKLLETTEKEIELITFGIVASNDEDSSIPIDTGEKSGDIDEGAVETQVITESSVQNLSDEDYEILWDFIFETQEIHVGV